MDYTSIYETRLMLQDLLEDISNFKSNKKLSEALNYEKSKDVLTKKEVDAINAIDKTAVNKPYTKWIMQKYLASTGGGELGHGDPELIRRFLFEDNERLSHALDIFDRLKKSKPEGVEIDIMKYATVHDLFDLTDKYEDKIEELSAPKAEKDIILVYEDERWQIVIPKTHEASRKYGTDTAWCTATANSGFYDRYSAQGPLIIIKDKANYKPGQKEAKWQVHVSSNSFMDAKDRPVENKEEIIKRLPAKAQQILSDKFGINIYTYKLQDMFSYRASDKNYDPQVILDLINKGANPHVNNDTIYVWAVQEGITSLVDRFLEDPDTDRNIIADSLIEAIKAEDLEFVDKIIKKAGPSAIDARGGRALISAAETNLELVKYLVENGADVNVGFGEPLARAAGSGKIGIIKYLLANGADIHANNEVAYWRAYHNKKPKTLELLIAYGAKPI